MRHGHQLIDTAARRLTRRSDKLRTYAEDQALDNRFWFESFPRRFLSDLADDLPHHELVKIVREDDRRLWEAGLIEHLGCLKCQVGQIARVEPDTNGLVSFAPQLLEDAYRVGYPAAERVDRV